LMRACLKCGRRPMIRMLCANVRRVRRFLNWGSVPERAKILSKSIYLRELVNQMQKVKTLGGMRGTAMSAGRSPKFTKRGGPSIIPEVLRSAR
jgi:hypothetical protein